MSTLRLFTGDDHFDSGPRIDGDQTLREFYQSYALPYCLVERKQRTFAEYETMLGFWEQATDDPRLLSIDDACIAQFRGWLHRRVYRGKPIVGYTIRKHLTALQSILECAGPRRARAKPSARLLAEVPVVPKPKVSPGDVEDVFTLEEIAEFVEACAVAKNPQGSVSPCFFWRTLWLFDYYTGLRPETFLQLRWEWLSEDEYGWWLRIPAMAMKMKRPHTCHVCRPAMQILHLLRGTAREVIFPWGMSESWLHTQRREILAASKIPSHRRFGFRGLRKALATELGKINPLAASMQLGHQGRNVTRDHYTHRKIVAEAMLSLPQPPWNGVFGERQKWLFA